MTMLVAIQGTTGSYSEDAALLLLGGGIEVSGYENFTETCGAVINGDADCAVLPLENKIVGSITAANTAVAEAGLNNYGSMSLKIKHVLAAGRGLLLDDLREVYSHPEAIKQCRRFFAEHPHLIACEAGDTAASVRDIIETGDPHSASICSENAARIYGAQIVMRDIADDIDNLTTFYVVAK
jgi:prephenate dehydratase